MLLLKRTADHEPPGRVCGPKTVICIGSWWISWVRLW